MNSILGAIVAAFLSLFGLHQSIAHIAPLNAPAVVAAAATSIGYSNNTTLPTSTAAPQDSTGVGNTGQPTIERVIEYAPLASQGFVTQDQLNALLLSLSNSLTAKFTAPAPSLIPQYVAAGGNSEAPYAAENQIGQLSNVTITNANLTASEIPALNYFPATDTIAVAFGGTGLASTPSYGQLLLGNGNGGYALVATSSLGIAGGGGGAPGGADTQVQFNSGGSFEGSSSFTFASSTDLLSVDNASTTNFTASYASTTNLAAVNATSTNLFSTNASTIDATSTNFFATLANFTTGIINTLSGTTLTYTAASTTNISASGEGYFGTASTTNLTISGSPSGFLQTNAQGVVSATSTFGAASIFGALAIANGGTGTSTTPSYGQLLIGNSSGGYSLVATSSLGISGAGGGSGTVTSITAGSGLTGGTITTSGTISLDLANANNWTGLQQFTAGASSSEQSVFQSAYFGGTATSSFNSTGQLTLANLASAVLSVNSSGQVVATSAISTSLLNGALGTVNGSALNTGGSIIVSAASSTALSDNNTFSGNDTFNSTISGSINGNANTATTLQAARTINGVSFNGSSNIIINAASSSVLGDSNTFSGADSFTNASSNFSGTWQTFSPSHFQTAGTYLTGLGNYATTTAAALSVSTSTLSWNGLTLGQTAVVSASGILFTPTLTGTINNSGLTNSSLTVSAGSGLSGGGAVSLGGSTSLSLNIGNANSWTGLQIFANASSTLATVSTLWLPNITAGSLLYSTSGNQVATAAATYPLQFSGGVLSLAFGTSTNNTFAGTQTFSNLTSAGLAQFTDSSSTLASVYSALYVGTTATTTISGTATSTFGAGISAAYLNLTGSSATSTAANGLNLSAGCFAVNGTCVGGSSGGGVTSITAGTGLTGGTITTSGTIALDLSHANGWTGLQQFSNASSSLFSAYGPAYFGSTATSSFDTSGNLNLASGDLYKINSTFVLNATTLGSGVTASSLTSVGTITSGTWTGTAIAVANGGTGATSASAARSNLGLGSMATQNTGISENPWCNTDGLGGLIITNGIVTGTSSGCDGDVAEYYGTVGPLPERGQIVALTASTTSFVETVTNPAPGESTSTPYTITISNVALATSATRTAIIGAVPTEPGLILGSQEQSLIASSTQPQLVALNGHVPVDMTLDGGPVAIGDPITVSTSTPGAGMKATTSGMILGYALAPYTGPGSGEDGGDMIEVFIVPQQWTAPQDYDALLALSQYGAATSSAPVAGSFMDTFIQTLLAQINQWLANAQNGIADLFAQNIHAQDELCVGSTCVTPAQFQAMAAAANASQLTGQGSAGSQPASSPSDSSSSESSATPPALQVKGDNPAIIQVGATYNDLGATITGPTADLNLGITTYVNGIAMSPVQIDTSQAATDTIDYVATDPSGLTATNTRIVVIEPADTPSIVPSDNASSTAATTPQ